MDNPSDTVGARERLTTHERFLREDRAPAAYEASLIGGLQLARDLRAILAENERLRDLLAQARVVCCAYGDWSPKGDDTCALRALLPAMDAALSNQQGSGE